MNINTSETDLTEMLSQAGVKVVCYRKLTQKPDAKYKWSTAVFFVIVRGVLSRGLLQ